MKLGIGTKLIVFAIAVGLFVGFAATLPAEAQTGEVGSGNITVLVLDDNDPSGTDVFLLSVSRGDYHTGHHYVFFVLRKTTIAGTAMTDYAENGTAAIGMYTIASPDRPFSWELEERTGEGEEDDMDDFSLLVNTDGKSAVPSFASSPDFETPTASSSPADNIYHTKIRAIEVDTRIDYWTGNYYGFVDVQVTVTDESD